MKLLRTITITAIAALSTTIGLLAWRVAASECPEPDFQTPWNGATVPASVRPWHIATCLSPPDKECLMHSGEESLPAAAEAAEECFPCSFCVSRFVRLTPSETPPVGQTYSLDCPPSLAGYIVANEMTIGDVEVIPPLDFEVTSIERFRGGECHSPWRLRVKLDVEGDPEAYFAQGGVIEVESLGQVVDVISRPSLDGTWKIPDRGDSIVLTAVATDGSRGEPHPVDREDFDGPGCSCSSGRDPGSFGLFLGCWLGFRVLRSGSRRRRGRGE
ncbi:MAG: hypothetical protein R3B09_06885 [Nannocystaceae bacterium]